MVARESYARRTTCLHLGVVSVAEHHLAPAVSALVTAFWASPGVRTKNSGSSVSRAACAGKQSDPAQRRGGLGAGYSSVGYQAGAAAAVLDYPPPYERPPESDAFRSCAYANRELPTFDPRACAAISGGACSWVARRPRPRARRHRREGHPMCLYLVRFDCLLAAEQLRIVVRFD